ncbi:MAG: 50S ribosomal protein L11 methyltransferase [Bacteroidales bacterium]|nr:50S ribosomal protein L11 methyltransferase [Bacteroidales bacterium]
MKTLEYRIIGVSRAADIEILLAFLNEEGYTGFVENDEELIAYLPEGNKNEEVLKAILAKVTDHDQLPEFQSRMVPDVNWNAEWESSFQPIGIEDTVSIRASFHEKKAAFAYDLVIDPKMSFGTGHHETTRLMIRAMLELPMRDKKVLDLGCGTGVLGIFASKLKADAVLAMDIDDWACKNSRENVERNQCHNIRVLQGSIDDLTQDQFHLILANINRNILLEMMGSFERLLTDDGILVLSGIMVSDTNTIIEAASRENFVLSSEYREQNWCAMVLRRLSN